MVESRRTGVLFGVDQNELCSLGTNPAVPELFGLLDPVGVHVGEKDLVTKISWQKPFSSLVVLQRALGESKGWVQQKRPNHQLQRMTNLHLAGSLLLPPED